ncbi:response regulator [Colwellia sp. MB3u-4]|uniref:response regulator n=1 Tax=Colwellia sp. MB3u-4 TaxID=2759822 RepID=UPI0015F4A397|nr:response regulator [Colwellia sp. MB3u-4]MBA6289251.1 response regulator [Colwellia sp. MB3u-4]
MNSRIDVLEWVQCLASSMIAKMPHPICCRLLNKTDFNQISLNSSPQTLLDLIVPNMQNAIKHAKHAITIKLYEDESQLTLAYLFDDKDVPLTSCQLPGTAILEQTLPELMGVPIKIKINSDDKLLKHCFRSFEQHMNIQCLTEESEENDAKSPWDIEINDFRFSLDKHLNEAKINSHPEICLRSLMQLNDVESSQNIDLYWPFFDSDLHSLLGEMKQLIKPRVLVADDSKPSKMATMIMLEHLGCTVSGADDGVEALELANQQPFDLIFLDEKMPRMLGSEVALQLSENKGYNQSTTKVSLTGITDENSVNLLYRKGINHHIEKPITKLVLENFLKKWRDA